ncbi:MAG TPA: hypothetical protein VE135_18115 [Pyrinomonadaceae bacterium]|nr:hypothetical protein [Pyrinomonadaceae bacterium]
MIPQRTPSRVSPEGGVRCRIAACRQRLRNSRITHRATIHSQIEKASRPLAGFPAEIAGAEPATIMDAAAGQMADLPDRPSGHGGLVLAAKTKLEEVGIT